MSKKYAQAPVESAGSNPISAAAVATTDASGTASMAASAASTAARSVTASDAAVNASVASGTASTAASAASTSIASPRWVQLYLRLALGIGFLVPGLDRLGVWGLPGGPNISWGDWRHFSAYAEKVMSFLPTGLADTLAAMATAGEIVFGIMLVIGWHTRLAALGGGLLTLGFAVSMAISFGITSPLNYSVFAYSAGSLLLSTIETYPYSIDNLQKRK